MTKKYNKIIIENISVFALTQSLYVARSLVEAGRLFFKKIPLCDLVISLSVNLLDPVNIGMFLVWKKFLQKGKTYIPKRLWF